MRRLALFFTFFIAAMCIQGQEIEIPAWVDHEVNETFARFNEWRGDDQVVVFPIQTDVHSGGRDTYRHVAYVNHAANTFGFDFIADLGDIGLDLPDTSTPEAARAFLDRHARIHQEYSGVSVVLVGNHDHNRNSGTALFTDQQLGETLNVPSMAKATPECQLVLALNPTYGYVNLPAKKTRVFFLNTSDRDDPKNYYTVSPIQLQFLADNMRFTEPGWNVIVLTHYCVRPIGHWNSDVGVGLHHGDTFLKILSDFNARAKGEAEGVVWDFTSNKDCRVIANLTGDSHFDSSEIYDGIIFAISQGYGGVAPQEMPEGSSVTKFDMNKMMLVDIAAFKPAKRELRLFRLGAGGADKDRRFDSGQ